MKSWIVPLLSLGLVVASASAFGAGEKDRYDVGEEIPTFTLRALNGDVLGESYICIDRYFGPNAKEPKKALLLSFFASYCEPCKKEMPLLAALYDSYKDKGLAVVLVSIDTEPDKIDVAKDLAKDAGVKFPVLSDRFNIVAKRYFVQKLPNSYLASSDGKVLMANVGYNEDISKRLVEEIRKAIGEPTSDPIPPHIAKYFGQGGSAEVVSVRTDGAAPLEQPTTVEMAPPPPPATAAAADNAPVTKAKAKAKTKARRGRNRNRKNK
jgi:thiol-disulfide isomerase/thioredoxin